ncbi:MAG TPA: hypothetical protein VJX10_04655, partial [Pseudonocardiaceae bacterium]|nr:hypothetical protein [Pseudonocardiaceae bacterium]
CARNDTRAMREVVRDARCWVMSLLHVGTFGSFIGYGFAAVFRERRLSGAVIGIAGAIGALGGVGINLAFRQSFALTGSGTPAVVGFLVYYGICAALTWLVYRPDRSPWADPRCE